ncbi:hypothetical protein OG21DRAFT_345094 [Imleria badia]|nr:hypothetical protein OG21DRAFT_345094 [Imleria badia]
MRRLSAFVLHATAAGIMAWGWFSLLDNSTMRELMTTQKGGYFLYLTNQGLIIAWSSMSVGLFCDVFPSVAVARHVKRALLMVSLSLEFVISTIYWSLLLFLPHLILPPTPPSQPTRGAAPEFLSLPLPIDLALHASPLFTLLIDFFVFESKFSKTYVHKAAPAVIMVFSVWYASFVEYSATSNRSFPYPFLTHTPFAIRVLIYATTAGIALGCFRTLNALHA